MAAGSGPFNEWEAVLSRSPYRVLDVDCPRIVRHWDDISSRYNCESVDLIDEQVWGTMLLDGLVPHDGNVLDIGCGTGSITKMFADAGANVLGLDISPGMLSMARRKCSDLSQVELRCQDWHDFIAGPDYDLVFSSFCPAVDDIASIYKMESLSRGRCCIVSLSGPSGDRLVLDILGEMGHPGLSLEGYDPSYPFFALDELGREPVLKSFSICQESVVSAEDMIDHLISCIELFQDVTPAVVRTITTKVAQRAEGGHLTLRDQRTVSVLHWRSGLASNTAPW
jgi:SAM-dependent methyltransferase